MWIFDSTNFIGILDLLGTFAFSISGIRLAFGKDIDWFGAYVIGLVTAIGGGTTRDILLDETPFWMENSKYLITTGVALLSTIIFKNKIFNLGKTLFLFDAIGLGLFTVAGISKSIALGFPIWVSIILGTITGSIGGVIRDIILNEVPLLFRRDIYAMACVAGGIVYFVCLELNILVPFHGIIAVSFVTIIRIIAVKFHLELPRLNLPESDKSNN